MQLGPSGGGGSGFNPDQYNSMSFSFFNPSAMMTGRRRALSKFGPLFYLYFQANVHSSVFISQSMDAFHIQYPALISKICIITKN